MIPLPTRSLSPIPRYLAQIAVWVINTEKKAVGLLIDHGYELVAPIFDGAAIRRKDEATEINPLIEAVLDSAALVVDAPPFPAPPLQLGEMGSSRYYTHPLIRDPPSSAQRAPADSLLRDYATPATTPKTGILGRALTAASVFRDSPRAVLAFPTPCAPMMCLPYAINHLFPHMWRFTKQQPRGIPVPIAIGEIAATTGIQFSEETGVRITGELLAIEDRSGVWHCDGIHCE